MKSRHLFFEIRPRGAIYSVKYGELCEATKVNSIKAATGYFSLMSLAGKSGNERWVGKILKGRMRVGAQKQNRTESTNNAYDEYFTYSLSGIKIPPY